MTHDELVRRACGWLKGTRCCRLVVSEPPVDGEKPDAIGWRHGEGSHLVECKISRNDFHADRRKRWRVHPAWGRGRGLGLYRWYLTPPGLLRNCTLPPCWGLAEAHPRQVRIVRPARQIRLEEWNYHAELWLLVKMCSVGQFWKRPPQCVVNQAAEVAGGE